MPKSNGEGNRVRIGAETVFELETSKSANAVWDPLMTMVQVPVPEHAPVQPLKMEPFAATGVSVTDVLILKFAAH